MRRVLWICSGSAAFLVIVLMALPYIIDYRTDQPPMPTVTYLDGYTLARMAGRGLVPIGSAASPESLPRAASKWGDPDVRLTAAHLNRVLQTFRISQAGERLTVECRLVNGTVQTFEFDAEDIGLPPAKGAHR